MPMFKMISPSELHSHEAVDQDRIHRVSAMMAESGHFYPPLLVDLESKVVLDGHHRLCASKELGCKRIPCYCVDYLEDDTVILESWRPDVNLTKQQVIDMGLSDGVFRLKTTRHLYKIPDSIEPTPLHTLTGGE
jgi:ParB-like chromosome segregation protein Spo0J